jgi:hypothetical protein
MSMGKNVKWVAVGAAITATLIVSRAARSETLNLTQLVGGNQPSGFLSTDSTGGQTVYASFGVQTSGTGVINPFLTIQQNNFEKGYNTSDPGNTTVMDDKFAGNLGHTRDLSFSELSGHNNSDGTYTFLLDANQAGDKLLTLDRLEVFSTGTPGQHVNDITLLTDKSLLYDSGAGNKVDLSADLVAGAGSGVSDISVTFKSSVFAGVTANKYIILYAEFGTPPGTYDSSDGFEEWTFLTGPGGAEPGPEPATIVSLATMAAGFGACYAVRRNRSQKNDV